MKSCSAWVYHPTYFLRYLRRYRILSNLLDTPRSARIKLWDELFLKHSELLNHVGAMKYLRISKGYRKVQGSKQAELYVLIRLLKPSKVLETGVEHGISTAFILTAMLENQHGHLYSIDKSNSIYTSYLGPLETGHLVTSNLRSRWTFIEGDTRRVLHAVMDGIGPVNMFIHDSEHSYQTMMFEFETAYPFVVDGGFLLSDDTSSNNSFFDFCHKLGITPTWTETGYGIIKKISHTAFNPHKMHDSNIEKGSR